MNDHDHDEGPQLIVPPPMASHDHRLILAGELTTAARLAPNLDADGLKELRAWLRHPDTARTAAGTALAELRGDLLDGVCRRLADLGAGPLEYFAGVGDLLLEAPLDASELL